MEIKTFHLNCGSKRLAGYLVSRNVKVPRERSRQSLQRVDPMMAMVLIGRVQLVLTVNVMMT